MLLTLPALPARAAAPERVCSVEAGVVADVALSGIEAWFPALVGRIQLSRSTHPGLSVRPRLLLEIRTPPTLLFRLPLTLDVPLLETTASAGAAGAYVGTGIATVRLDRYRFVPMVVGGAEIGMAGFLVLDVASSVLFEPGNVDVEASLALGFRFAGR